MKEIKKWFDKTAAAALVFVVMFVTVAVVIFVLNTANTQWMTLSDPARIGLLVLLAAISIGAAFSAKPKADDSLKKLLRDVNRADVGKP